MSCLDWRQFYSIGWDDRKVERQKVIEFFFIFPPFVFGNSDGKAKGYTLNYYYYYYISLKTRKKLLHINKRFDSKI